MTMGQVNPGRGNEPSFAVFAPPATAPATALVFASPHSGDIYPSDMAPCAALTATSLRSAEDCGVDRLVVQAPRRGATLIAGRMGRAYVDLNRDPAELDPELVDGVAGPVGAKTAAGYGVLPRLSGDGRPLYDRRLSLAEAVGRLDAVHAPYHAGLEALMLEARSRCGRGVLIDWHSMPARAADVDVVLGDRHGASCDTRLTRRLTALFERQGWRVALNRPYAGGWSTQRWGRPEDGLEAIQVELSRRLYLDEATLAPNAAYGATKTALARVIADLCAENWAVPVAD